MQINLTGHHVEVTAALKSFVQEKFDRITRHFDRITAIHVILEVEKLKQRAEATILVSKGEIHASAESEDMYTSIDALIDKLDRQLVKHKEKISNHRE